MMLPAFKGIDAVFGIEGLTNPRGFIADRRAPAQPEVQEHLRGRRLRRDPAGRGDAGADRRAEDRLHDRVDGDGDRAQHPRRARRQGARPRRRPGTPSAWPTSATPASRSSRCRRSRRATSTGSREGKWVHLAKIAFEKYFIRKMKKGHVRAVLREVRDEGARHRQAQGSDGSARERHCMGISGRIARFFLDVAADAAGRAGAGAARRRSRSW